jgi:hypothetical protein
VGEGVAATGDVEGDSSATVLAIGEVTGAGSAPHALPVRSNALAVARGR